MVSRIECRWHIVNEYAVYWICHGILHKYSIYSFDYAMSYSVCHPWHIEGKCRGHAWICHGILNAWAYISICHGIWNIWHGIWYATYDTETCRLIHAIWYAMAYCNVCTNIHACIQKRGHQEESQKYCNVVLANLASIVMVGGIKRKHSLTHRLQLLESTWETVWDYTKLPATGV